MQPEPIYGAVDIDPYGQPRIGDWIQTYNKHQFHALDPRSGDFDIEDIAHALSLQCRFSGHTRVHYSVAEHSIRVADLCPPEHKLWALLHDASEAYLVDIPRPFKRLPEFAFYREIEAKTMEAICDQFGLPRECPECVHKADEVMLATEARDLMGPLVGTWHLREAPLDEVVIPMSSLRAKAAFLYMHIALEADRASRAS